MSWMIVNHATSAIEIIGRLAVYSAYNFFTTVSTLPNLLDKTGFMLCAARTAPSHDEVHQAGYAGNHRPAINLG